MKIKCIAIDDEPLALDKMRDYILRVGYLDLLETFDNGLDAIDFMKENQVDLIFLDIQMEELTGIQMLEAMKEKPKVILTTAYHEYAVQGYELDVCDYLLKPISFQRFLQACEKVSEMLQNQSTPQLLSNVPETENEQQEYFFVKNGNITQKINFDDILFVEGMKDYLRIHTPNEKVMTLLSFKKLEEILPADQFIRIHKSYVIAIDKMDSIERSRVKIAGQLLPIGDSYRKDFLSVIDRWKVN